MADSKIFKIALPWLFGALGGNKLLSRIIHVPNDVLPFTAASARALAGLENVLSDQDAMDFWRAVERTQQQITSGGIMTQ
jgi:hypothetical protein